MSPSTDAITLNDLWGRGPGALCAFNVETYDTLASCLAAASTVGCPVVVGVSVPVAKAFGYEYLVRLAELVASRHPATHVLHLDHGEDPADVRDALRAGFGSANFLNEGAMSADEYLAAALALREEFPDRPLEFVFGTLGHAEGSSHDHGSRHHHPEADTDPHDLDAVVAFADACQPDVLGFDVGSLHGMLRRSRELDIASIREVSKRTGRPMVLHGSSGVSNHSILKAIDAGVCKVNVETALRETYMGALRQGLAADEESARKPRKLMAGAERALREAMIGYLRTYTLRQDGEAQS